MGEKNMKQAEKKKVVFVWKNIFLSICQLSEKTFRRKIN